MSGMTPENRDGASADALQHRIAAFVRAFGLHQPDETPCGAPIPVSEAHAVTLLAEGGMLSQNELARQLRLTKSTVSRLVDQLEDRGWVCRHTDAADARRRLVGLTDDGRKAATEIALLRSARFARLLDRVPPDERTNVLDALDVLLEAADDR